MARTSVMLICGRHPRHLYVANRICQSFEPVLIVQESGPLWTDEKVPEARGLGGIVGNAWRTIRGRPREDGQEARFFFGDRLPQIDRRDLLKVVARLNDPEVLELARHHRPDIIAVVGGSLIKAELVETARLGIVNLCGGMSPRHRGSDGVSWVSYQRKPGAAGFSVHFIRAGVHASNVIAHILPGLSPGDDEKSTFWRGFRDSAEVYVQAIQRLAEGEPLGLLPRDEASRLVLRHRTALHDAELSLRMRRGLLRGVAVKPQVRWFSPQGG